MGAAPIASKLLVVNVVGLTPRLLGDHTPRLRALASSGFQASFEGVFPAVTCSTQASMLTGKLPSEHGIVGNGWYFRDLSEVWLWRQSNRLVQGEKVWERLRRQRPGFTCAKLFWWYNMYSSADWSVSPRPVYFADGRKAPSIYTQPPELKDQLDAALGAFPLFKFWGPMANIASSDWIARCAEFVLENTSPDLALVYLPHLDYDLQRFGPADPRIAAALSEIDNAAGKLIDAARARDYEVIVLSEYGISEVRSSVSINRVLREAGLLRVQETIQGELLDTGACRAFAVSDHQIAHVYVQDPTALATVRRTLEEIDGVERVLDRADQEEAGIAHPRAGELIAVSKCDRWFDYYYWLDDDRAPDFARTVEIHRKPGYDPVELFLDPRKSAMGLRIASKILRKKLGFRTLLDVIPLDASLVRGSHGRLPDDPRDGPIFLSSTRLVETSSLRMTDLPDVIERICLG
jgi:predicted AlkP superfamily pyrophosphatase or phosphodiesterase